VLALRLIALGVLVAVVAALVLYLTRRDRRYLVLAWKILAWSVVAAVVTGVAIVVERLVTRG
jgi:hypothetical protein